MLALSKPKVNNSIKKKLHTQMDGGSGSRNETNPKNNSGGFGALGTSGSLGNKKV